jgi:hypothetical protein
MMSPVIRCRSGMEVRLLADSGPFPWLAREDRGLPAERTTMRQVREVRRLKFVGGDTEP